MSLYDRLNSKYPDKVPATDAFFRNSTNDLPSFRLALSNPKWEFLFRNHTGAAITGTLFHNRDVFDGDEPLLSKDQSTEADFTVYQEREDDVFFVRVEFFEPGSDDLLGEFLAQDPRNTSVSSGLINRTSKGAWEFVTDDPLYDQLDRKYDGRKTGGNALFSTSALRFRIGELGWQFLYDNPAEGPGLDGTLFYNDHVFGGSSPKLPQDRPTRADFLVEQQTQNNRRYVIIKFFESGTQTTELLGEFLSEDPSNSSGGLSGRRNTGEWSFVGTESLYDSLAIKYQRREVADTFFLRSSTSFLLVVYGQNKEFSEGRTVGHRVVGTIFYNDGFFDVVNSSLPTNYIVLQVKEKEVLNVHIKFYSSNSQTESCEFLAKDPRDVTSTSAILYQRRTGAWTSVSYSTTTGTATKSSNDTRITITFPSINRMVQMDCLRQGQIWAESFNVPGLLTVKNIDAPGDIVRWFRDRAIFYPSASASEFSGFFFPTDLTLNEALGTMDDMQWVVQWRRTW